MNLTIWTLLWLIFSHTAATFIGIWFGVRLIHYGLSKEFSRAYENEKLISFGRFTLTITKKDLGNAR